MRLIVKFGCQEVNKWFNQLLIVIYKIVARVITFGSIVWSQSNTWLDIFGSS